MSGDNNVVQRDCVEVQLFGVDENWKYTPDADFHDVRKGWLTRSRIESLMQCIENSTPGQDPVILQLVDTNEDLGIEFVNDKGNYKCTRHVGHPPEEESTTDFRESCLWMTEFVNANKQRVTPAPNSEFNLFLFMDVEPKEVVSENATTSIPQSSNQSEEIDDLEIAYLQDLIQNGNSAEERNWARWGLHAKSSEVVKAKKTKSVFGWITLLLIITVVLSPVALITGLIWITFDSGRNHKLTDGVMRCSYCDEIIPKDGFIKSLSVEKPIKRHWDETGHLREIVNTSSKMTGEKVGWLTNAKLNYLEK